MATGFVIDASALLAYFQGEPGSAAVQTALSAKSVMSIVNYAEVLTRLGQSGGDPATIHRELTDQGLFGGLLDVVPLTEEDAVTVAKLRHSTRAHGLSLGDRACLATGLRFCLPVITADRTWVAVQVGVEVQLIRP